MTQNHVVSSEIAKELKEAGWKKETEFWWNAHDRLDLDTNTTYKDNFSLDNFNKWGNVCGGYESLSAPLATEILEELPKIDDSDNLAHWHFEIELTKGGMYYCRYVSIDNREIPDNSKEEDEDKWMLIDDIYLPNALAKMWLYLKKEKLV